MKPEQSSSRRTFIKNTTVAAGSLLVSPLAINHSAYAAGLDTIKVGLVGCGGRGTGAAVQALRAAPNARLVAMVDVFRDKLDGSYQNMKQIEDISSQVTVSEENRILGFEGYKAVIDQSDVVILATPPGFRPDHFEEAVNSSKHVFMEKPVASDAPGVRKVLAAGKLATEKNLKIVVGLQNRYDPEYQEMVSRIQDGQIGDIVSSTCYYMKGQYKIFPRSQAKDEMEFQIRNWHFFNWLWAGAPAGLQIHNTDIVNWVKGSYPVQAQGMGGRAAIDGPDTGEVFDHFYIEYSYEDGMPLHSQIRVMENTYNKNGAFFIGTDGSANNREGIKDRTGNRVWKYRNKDKGNPYQIEHNQLFEAIMNDQPLNDTEFGAKSTMTSIMGRMACHSGQLVTWDEAFNSELRLAPNIAGSNPNPPILPDENGIYAYPTPGVTKAL